MEDFNGKILFLLFDRFLHVEPRSRETPCICTKNHVFYLVTETSWKYVQRIKYFT